MYIFERNVPLYLTNRTTITRTILFTAIFALAFLNIYTPFGVTNTIRGTKLQLFLYSNLAILTGMLVIVISRVLMVLQVRRRPLSYFGYSLWIVGEIISMAAFYALFDIYYLKDPREPLSIIQASVRNTALVILLPYTILWLYFSWRDKVHQLKQLLERPVKPKGIADMVPFSTKRAYSDFQLKTPTYSISRPLTIMLPSITTMQKTSSRNT